MANVLQIRRGVKGSIPTLAAGEPGFCTDTFELAIGTGSANKFFSPNPMSAAGDIIYGGASGVMTRLAKGTDGQVLTLADGVPSWLTGGPLTGSVLMWPIETVPDGYLECNGASLLRADYAALFAVIGTVFGAADATHFNIPDLRGRIPRAWDHGHGDDPDAASRTKVGATGATMTAGDHVGTEQDHAVESHTHPIGYWANTAGATMASPGVYNIANGTATGATGGNETRPVNTYLMFIIKT